MGGLRTADTIGVADRGLAGLKAAWALFPVKVGFLGSLVITLGSFSAAYLPQASPIWNMLRPLHLDGVLGKALGTILAVAGVFLLANAWFRLRHTVYRLVNHLWVVALWSLPLVFAPPVFSHDAYSYAAQGWMIHNGQNPYDSGPGVMPGPFADLVSWVWRYTPAPYGPLSLQIQHGLTDLSGFHPWVAAWLMRFPALVGVALIVVLLPRIASAMGFNRDRLIWFACLNPLLIIDYVGGCHNDALMMGLVVLGLWIGTRRRWWYAAAVVIGLGAAIKQPAVMAAWVLPLMTIPLLSWRDKRAAVLALVRSALAVIIAAASFCLVSLACGLGFGWINAIEVPGLVPSISPTWIIGSVIQAIADPGNQQYVIATGHVFTALGVIVVIALIIKFGPREPFRALAWSFIAVALSASALHSWYMLWGFLLLPLVKGLRQIPWIITMVVIFLLTYNAMNFSDRNGLIGRIIAVCTIPFWLGSLYLYHRFRKRKGQVARHG